MEEPRPGGGSKGTDAAEKGKEREAAASERQAASGMQETNRTEEAEVLEEASAFMMRM